MGLRVDWVITAGPRRLPLPTNKLFSVAQYELFQGTDLVVMVKSLLRTGVVSCHEPPLILISIVIETGLITY